MVFVFVYSLIADLKLNCFPVCVCVRVRVYRWNDRGPNSSILYTVYVPGIKAQHAMRFFYSVYYYYILVQSAWAESCANSVQSHDNVESKSNSTEKQPDAQEGGGVVREPLYILQCVSF